MSKPLSRCSRRAQEANLSVANIHRSPAKGNTWDVGMIDNKQFDELHMQCLAKHIGKEERVFGCARLTVPLHA